MKKIIIVAIILLSIAGVVGQSLFSTAPVPIAENGNIQVCWTYEVINGKETVKDIECRTYPADLKERCYYGRYDKLIRCEDILLKTINEDVLKWQQHTVARKHDDICISEGDCTVDNVKMATAEDPSLTPLIGKNYDFNSEEFK